MVNQIEYHPRFGQTESAKYYQEHGIIVEAWSPLGCGEVLQNKTLKQLADKYKKAQHKYVSDGFFKKIFYLL